MANIFGNDINMRKKHLDVGKDTNNMLILGEDERKRLKVFLEKLKILTTKNVDVYQKAVSSAGRISVLLESLHEEIFSLADQLGKLSESQKNIEDLCGESLEKGRSPQISTEMNDLKMSLYEWCGVYKKKHLVTKRYLCPAISRLASDNKSFYELFRLRSSLAKDCITKYKSFELEHNH